MKSELMINLINWEYFWSNVKLISTFAFLIFGLLLYSSKPKLWYGDRDLMEATIIYTLWLGGSVFGLVMLCLTRYELSTNPQAYLFNKYPVEKLEFLKSVEEKQND